MAHRLIASMCRAHRILKNAHFNGSFNIVAQVQPRYSELRKFLLHFKVYLPREAPKKTKKSFGKEANNGGAKKMKGNGTTENTKIDKRIDNASSTTPLKSAPIAPIQGSKSGGNGGGGGGRKNRRGPVSDEKYLEEQLAYLFIINAYVASMSVGFLVYYCKKSYEEITWDDFVENYLDRGRAVKYYFLKKNWIQFQTASVDIDGAKTFRVRIDSLNFYIVSGLLARTLEDAQREMKAEPENELPLKDQDQELIVSLRARFIFIIKAIGRRSYEKLREHGRKARRLLISRRLTAALYERIFTK